MSSISSGDPQVSRRQDAISFWHVRDGEIEGREHRQSRHSRPSMLRIVIRDQLIFFINSSGAFTIESNRLIGHRLREKHSQFCCTSVLICVEWNRPVAT